MKTKNANKSKNVVKNAGTKNVVKNVYIDESVETTIDESIEILNEKNIQTVKNVAKPAVKREKTGICSKLVNVVTPLLDDAKYTKKQILEFVLEKMPDLTRENIVTFNTLLTDSKNDKYNKFPKLVVQNRETGTLSFISE